MTSRSSTRAILLVACGKKAEVKSSLSIPEPLSDTQILSFPPRSISIEILVAPASMLFSCARGLFTQQLCAASLELLHPVTGQPLVISTRKTVSTGDEQLHFDALLAQHDARVV